MLRPFRGCASADPRGKTSSPDLWITTLQAISESALGGSNALVPLELRGVLKPVVELSLRFSVA
jgi:hypothetical protein